MTSPLIVIDVQDPFIDQLGDEGKDILVRHVIRAIRKAQREDRHVVLVEYEKEGPLNDSVCATLKGYAKRSRVIKSQDDGSDVIHRHLDKKRLSSIRTLTVCGVNLDCCVLETVAGLVHLGYRCRIVKEATCNAYEGYYPPTGNFWQQVHWMRENQTRPTRRLSRTETEKNVQVLSVRSA